MNGMRLSRRVGTAAALFVALAFSGGCMVGPDYVRPDAEVNADWLVSDYPAFTAETTDLPDWWAVFDDPVLTQLIHNAYEQNLSLEAAGLRVLQARARRGIAVGEFFPQEQSINGDVGRANLSRNDANTALIDRHFATAGLGLDVAWELDFWGRYRRGIQSADAVLLASIASYDDVLVTLLAEVAGTYVDVRTLERRIELARANVELQRETLDITEVRFRNGATTELDVTEARATLANTQATVPSLEADLRTVKLALCVLLGRPPDELEAELAGGSGIPAAPTAVALGAPAELLRRRPDVRLAERIAAARSEQIGIATADLYPSVFIAGSTGFAAADTNPASGSGKNLDSMFDSDSFSGFVGLGFNWPILNYGRVKNNIRVQDASFQEAVANYRNAVLQAAAEVESSLYAFLRERDRRTYLTESVDAAARALDLATTQYTEGQADFIRVNDANSFLTFQQDQEAQAVGLIAQRLILAFKALGGGWDIRSGNEFVPADTLQEMRERTDWGDVIDPDYDSRTDLIFERPDSNEGTPLAAPAVDS
ncbi:MAG: efflux transporter outer membrane subunit [Planctomycetes bacterium]|nr:efflux transporter outer membrane subunit [Planctomycetota bacterium]